MNERAIIEIMSILDEYEDPPHSDWPQQEADEVTFSRCAIEEILSEIWDHPWNLASDTIERFALKQEAFDLTAITDVQHRIFSIAAETAYELLDVIREVEY